MNVFWTRVNLQTYSSQEAGNRGEDLGERACCKLCTQKMAGVPKRQSTNKESDAPLGGGGSVVHAKIEGILGNSDSSRGRKRGE